jgi:hypothetical protein
MRIKMLASAAVVGGALATSGILGGIAPAGATVTQNFKCTAIGPVTPSFNASVTALATINKTTKVITLKSVVFTIHNTFGVSATINSIKFEVNDPNANSAPYVTGSVKAATLPAGWTAGHDTGIFVEHAASETFKALATLKTAALSANYTDVGPVGTVINFTAGDLTFNITSPVTQSETCTPSTPEKIMAHVTE